MNEVHYFYDPMCGWCYGATSLIQAIAEHPQFTLVYHPGGMIERKALTEGFKQHVLQADPRIAALTGASFGEAYIERLKSEQPFILDSYLPIRAISIAQSMGIEAYKMIKAIQNAHYQEGLVVSDEATLAVLAQRFGLNEVEWQRKMQESADHIEQEIIDSHELMAHWSVSGYPTLIANINNQFIKLPHEQFYGKQAQWHQLLDSLVK
ncbi:DsbA family protein [Vibrio tritonius]|uniref:DsbA family protein n=1 Tax=Vibrio tritonius TaxID=1435069 RepID=UPI00083827F7|nr:DsbA family protein [Vibrio tritonius]